MQIVFQEPYESLNPRMTVGKLVAEPLKLWSRLSVPKRKEEVRRLARQVGLQQQCLEQYPRQLGGGVQQRVSIARAIATEPDFIVLDEPTSLLDPVAHVEIMELLGQLQEALGFAYLFISHDLVSVERICHRVAIMYLGKIVELGSTKQIFDSPQHPYSQSLLSSVLYPEPSVVRSQFSLRGEIPSPIELPSGCYFYSRCPVAASECQKAFPPLVSRDNGTQVACYRAGQFADLRTARFEDRIDELS
jgi:oligopeptide/dipeptide ABC transporter ATP-binding protein